MIPGPVVVSAIKVNYTYGEGHVSKQILFDIDVELYEGEVVLLTGPSGSGKTTLLTLIGGLRSAQTGSINVLGIELLGATAKTLVETRRKLGFIFQAHNLHRSLSALANVRMGLELHEEYSPSQMDVLSTKILGEVGLGDRILHMPDALSGGEKQRVAIARALVSHPRLVLADEPTAALDSKSGREVADLMQKLAHEQKTTILLVTHDNRILDIADRVLALDDGRIVISNSEEAKVSL